MAAALLLAAGGPAAAQTPTPVRDPDAKPEATKARADSVVVDTARTLPNARVIGVGDIASPEARRARRDSIRAAQQRLLDQPRFVMLRSLLVPGWGQLHNRAWIKSVLVAGGETAMILQLVKDSRALDDLEADVAAARAGGDVEAQNLAVERYNARLDSYVGRQWLLGAVLVYALIDAYVDAHFVHFEFEFDQDPARPAGVRVGMEKRF